MCIFRDPSSQIEDNNSNNSTIDYRSNPNANWNTLMSDTEKKLALRELITIYKHFKSTMEEYAGVKDYFSFFYYRNFFEMLDANNELQFPDKPERYGSDYNLINLKEDGYNFINMLPPAIVYQSCVISSIFLVIKQLAASSGYTQNNDKNKPYTLTINNNNFNWVIFKCSNNDNTIIEVVKNRFFDNIQQSVDTIITDRNHIAYYYEEILLREHSIKNHELYSYYRANFFELLTNPQISMGMDWNNPEYSKSRKYEFLTFLTSFFAGTKSEEELKSIIINIYKSTNSNANSNANTNYKDIDSINKVFIEYYARYYYYALTNRTINNASDRPRTIIIAYGDGSSTVGFLNIKDLGCVLFNFQNTVTEKSIRLSRNEQMHFHVFGYNPAYPEEESPYKHIYTLKIRDSTGFELPLKFEGTRDCKNGLKPKRFGINNSNCYYTSPSYDLPTDNNIIDNDRYTDFYYFNGNQNERIARFDNSDNILKIYKEDVTVDFDIKPEDPDPEIDEIVFIATVAPDNFSKRYNLIYFNEFDSGKFELTQEEIQELYRQNKQAFDTIFDNLRNKDFSFYVGMEDTSTITGEFVGKKSSNNYEYSPNDIVADTQYSFCNYSNTPEISCKAAEALYKELRKTRVLIYNDYVNKKICISIVSHTSPVVIDFNDLFNSSYTPPNMSRPDYDDLINRFTKYKVSSDDQRPSQNQVLAMLRSMGMFEAIYSILYVKANNDASVISKLNDLKENVSCMDRTGTVRGHEELNLVNPLFFADYDSYKWYKNEDDYNKYLHGEYNNLNLE